MAAGTGGTGWTLHDTNGQGHPPIPAADTGAVEDGALHDRDMRPAPATAMIDIAQRIAERFGVPVAILAFVLWWVRHDLVQPLMHAHFDLIERIVAGQEEHTREVQSIGRKLDELIDVSSRK